MRGRTYTIHPNQRAIVAPLDQPPTLHAMQDACGGYIEGVPYFNMYWSDEDRRYVSCVAYCNEYGKLNGLPFNSRATLAWDDAMRHLTGDDGKPAFPTGLLDDQGKPSDTLCGTIYIVVGDEEFMREHVVGKPDEEDDPEEFYEDWWQYGTFYPACQTLQT